MSTVQRRNNNMQQSQYDRSQYTPVAGQQYGYTGPIRNDRSGGVYESVGDAKYGLKAAAQSINKYHMLMFAAVISIFLFLFSDLSNYIMPGTPVLMSGVRPQNNAVVPITLKYSDLVVSQNDEVGVTHKTYISPNDKIVPNLRSVYVSTYKPHTRLYVASTIDASTQMYVVKSGTVTFKLGKDTDTDGASYELNENDSIVMPKLAKYTIINDSDDNVELMVTLVN